MSEQQVLPELIATLKAAAEKATPGPWRAVDYWVEGFDIDGEPCTIAECEMTPYDHDANYISAASPENILKLLASLAQSEAERERLQADGADLKRKLALIFDQSCYSDSLGVEGSSFLVCRWCGGGSGPGGKPAFSHNKGCLLDNDELEKEVAGVWEEVPELEKELSILQIELARERELNQGLRQVVSRVRDVIDRCLKVHVVMEGPKPYLTNLQYLTNELYALSIADALLEPKSKPVATTS